MKKIDVYLLLALLIGLLLALASLLFAPYPFVYDTDIFRHLKLVNEILNGQFVWGAPAYLGFFHYFFAGLAILLGLKENAYVLLWGARFLFIPLYAVGVYLFVKEFLKNKYLAIFASLLAPLICIEFLNLINTAPKILSLVSLPFFLFWLDRAKRKTWPIILIVIFSLAIHIYMGLANLFLIFSWFLLARYANRKIMFWLAVLPVAFILLQSLGLLHFSGQAWSIFGEADLRNFNLDFYFSRLGEYFSPIILLFAILGVGLRRQEKKFIAFVPPSLFLLAGYFLPINASFRLLAPLVLLVVLFALVFLLDFSRLINSRKIKISFITVFSLAALAGFVFPYARSIASVTALSENENNFTLASPREYAAAAWLKDNAKGDYIIISDPVNMLLNESTNNLLPQNTDVSKIFNTVFSPNLEKETFQYLSGIRKETQLPVYVLIDGRTSFWRREGKDNPEVYQAPNQDKSFQEFRGHTKFKDGRKYKLIYDKDGLYIYQVL